MKRRLFTILSALSFLLFLAFLTLWVKSYFRADLIGFDILRPPVFTEWFVRSNYGILYFARNDFHSGEHVQHPLIWVSHEPHRGFCGPAPQGRSPCFTFGPFSLGRDAPGSGTFVQSAFTLPHWSLASVTVITPLIWLHRSRRLGHRLRNRLCIRCGYDLRATPDRCPECGKPPAPAGVQTSP